MRDTVQSLKKENDSLKAQLDALTNDFKSLQRNLEQQSATGGRKRLLIQAVCASSFSSPWEQSL